MATATKERLKQLIDRLTDEAAEELESALAEMALGQEEREWHAAFGALHASGWASPEEAAYTESDIERARAKSGTWAPET